MTLPILDRFVDVLDKFLGCWTGFHLFYWALHVNYKEEEETHRIWVRSYGIIGLGFGLFEWAGNGFFLSEKE